MSRLRVLIIDDDPAFRSYVSAELRRDYLVFVAADAIDGIQKALQHTPDLVLIDALMPRIDGIQCLQKFREIGALQSVVAIVTAAKATRQIVIDAIQAGAADFIIKTDVSDNSNELLRRVVKALGQTIGAPQTAEGDVEGAEQISVTGASAAAGGNAAKNGSSATSFPATLPDVPTESSSHFVESRVMATSEEPELTKQDVQALMDAWE